ncbi:MAG: ShlB/FhaC/HecB family hemolysin secretion/activation protein [Gammaproteobacteria bacterium]|nr:ShlB/FhaC/HecB family hemolysin secretion/activation protein [Gammaproteobacteria bacterium]
MKLNNYNKIIISLLLNLFFYHAIYAEETGLNENELKIKVERYEIIGINPISNEDTRELLKPYTGKTVSLEQIQKAVIALEDKYKQIGFGFYYVTLAPQTLENGVVKLSVKPLVVSKINLKIAKEQGSFYSEENILSSIPALKKNQSPNLHQVIKQVELNNLNPTKQVNVLFSVNEETFEDIVADVKVQLDNPVKFFSWLDNSGSKETGYYRLGVGLKHHNFLDKDHEISATYTTSPDHIEEVKQFGLNYRIPFYEQEGILQLYSYYSDVDSGTVAGGFDVSGEGQFFGAKYEWYLSKLAAYKNYSHQFVVGVEDKLFKNSVLYNQEQVGKDIRSTPLSLLYKGKWKTLGYDLSFNVQYDHNLAIGEFNSDFDYNLNRENSKANWDVFKVGVRSNWLKQGYRLSTQIDLQLTDQRLISGEQFGLGGLTGKLRGFDSREVNGDNGLKGSIELWLPPLLNNKLNVLGFIDAGYVKAINPLPDEMNNETLVSTGVGLVFNLFNKLDASLYLATVLDGNDTGLSDDPSKNGDFAAHATIYLNF